MKTPTRILISITILVFLNFSCSEKKENEKIKQLKSVYGLQNDTIVSIKKYDRQGRQIFDRTTQIIGDWNNDLMSWMTAYEFENGRLKYEYYAHSNSGLRIKSYDYDQNGNLRNEYVKELDPSQKSGRNPYSEIYQIETVDSLVSYLTTSMPDSVAFKKKNRSTKESTDVNKTYRDSQNLHVHEYWTLEDNRERSRLVEKFDSIGNLVFRHYKTLYNEGIEHFNYDREGNLVEEIEIYDLEENRFQKKEHYYNNGLLQKTLFYHDTALAFRYEYFYTDTLLNKEIMTRVIDSEHFKNRKKIATTEYRYEYFE